MKRWIMLAFLGAIFTVFAYKEYKATGYLPVPAFVVFAYAVITRHNNSQR